MKALEELVNDLEKSSGELDVGIHISRYVVTTTTDDRSPTEPRRKSRLSAESCESRSSERRLFCNKDKKTSEKQVCPSSAKTKQYMQLNIIIDAVT